MDHRTYQSLKDTHQDSLEERLASLTDADETTAQTLARDAVVAIRNFHFEHRFGVMASKTHTLVYSNIAVPSKAFIDKYQAIVELLGRKLLAWDAERPDDGQVGCTFVALVNDGQTELWRSIYLKLYCEAEGK